MTTVFKIWTKSWSWSLTRDLAKIRYYLPGNIFVIRSEGFFRHYCLGIPKQRFPRLHSFGLSMDTGRKSTKRAVHRRNSSCARLPSHSAFQILLPKHRRRKCQGIKKDCLKITLSSSRVSFTRSLIFRIPYFLLPKAFVRPLSLPYSSASILRFRREANVREKLWGPVTRRERRKSKVSVFFPLLYISTRNWRLLTVYSHVFVSCSLYKFYPDQVIWYQTLVPPYPFLLTNQNSTGTISKIQTYCRTLFAHGPMIG